MRSPPIGTDFDLTVAVAVVVTAPVSSVVTVIVVAVIVTIVVAPAAATIAAKSIVVTMESIRVAAPQRVPELTWAPLWERPRLSLRDACSPQTCKP